MLQFIRDISPFGTSSQPLISQNNYYLANAGDGLGWKIVPYDFNTAGSVFCNDDICNTRYAHWSVIRPTCGALEDNFLAGPLLTDPELHSRYLEYVREFVENVMSDEGLINEIQSHLAEIKPYVNADFWSLFGAFFDSELTPDSANWEDEDDRIPLLPFMKARVEDLRQQFAVLDDNSFPRGPPVGILGKNEDLETCPDWRTEKANRNGCPFECYYEGCHIAGYTVESFCDEETSTCLHGDHEQRCWGVYDGEPYPGMGLGEDGRKRYCQYIAGVPVLIEECPAVGPDTVVLDINSARDSSAPRPKSVLYAVIVAAISVTFIL